MYGAYQTGLSFGYFLGGALMGGVIPMIIFAVKKRWGLAVMSPLLCGFASFIHPIASIILGIILIICAVKTTSNE